MSESRDRSQWRRRIAGVFLLAAVLGGLFVAGRWLWLERSMARWSEHLEETVAWYEEHVGSLDLESYRLSPVADEENTGRQLLVLLDDFPLSDEERSDVRRFTDRSFDLYRVAEEAEADAGWTDAEREQLRELLARSDAFLRRLDEWASLSASSFGVVAGENAPDRLIDVVKVGRLRLAEVGLRLEQGDCGGASQLLVANSRMTQVLDLEPHLLLHLLGRAPEQDFYEGAQRALQAQLEGVCRSRVDLDVLQASFDALASSQERFAYALAAEGALHYTAMAAEPGQHGPGINPCFMTSSSLMFLGEASQRVNGVEVEKAPDRGRLSRTCARLADLLWPNMEYAIQQSLRSRYTRTLTGRLLDVARCVEDSDCALGGLPPFVGPNGERAAVRGEGDRRVVELTPGIDEPTMAHMAHRRQTLETVTVPEELAAAF